MTRSIVDTLNSAFGLNSKPQSKAPRKTKLIAVWRGDEYGIERDFRGLWTVTFEREFKNSKLDDLIEQLEGFGATVERVSA